MFNSRGGPGPPGPPGSAAPEYDNDVTGLNYFFPDQSPQNVQYKVDLDY